MAEIWKTIEEFPNYCVSNLGDVKVIKTGRILKQITTSPGYKTVSLSNKSVSGRARFCHRLVAQTFLPNPENKPEVDHIDRIRHNNKLSNLRWVTKKENGQNMRNAPADVKYRRSVWKCDKKTGERLELFESTTLAAKTLPCNNIMTGRVSICQVARGASNSAYEFKWEYDDHEVVEGEIWRELEPMVIGRPGGGKTGYFISDKGRLKDPRGFVKKPSVSNQGYLQLSVHNRVFLAHRLIALTFLEKPPGKDIVNHIDGDRSNCNLSNLEFVTQSENILHAHDIGLKRGRVSICQYELSGKFIKKYSGLTAALHEINISPSSLKKAIHTFTTPGGFQWRIYKGSTGDIEPSHDTRYRFHVLQYTMSGDFITEFCTSREAARAIGVNSTAIRNACRVKGYTCKNFQWRQKYSDIPVDEVKKSATTFPIGIKQLSMDGSVIMEYKSLIEASEKTGFPYLSVVHYSQTDEVYQGCKWVRVEKDEGRKRKRSESDEIINED